MSLSTQQAAGQKRSTHSMRLGPNGASYIDHGRSFRPPGNAGLPPCVPDASAAEGSAHNLRPPRGAPAKVLYWHPAAQEWSAASPMLGNRMGWTAAYLGSHGWTYGGPYLALHGANRSMTYIDEGAFSNLAKL